MELSERCIQTLEKEGFTSVYEWSDEPGVVYDEHQHQDRVTIFITEGSLAIEINGEIKNLLPGDRFDVPPQVPHRGVVGPSGCQYVVGEMTPGDSWRQSVIQ